MYTPMITRDAGDLLQFPVAFRATDGADLVPTRVRYRMTDLTSGATVLDWTDHGELAADTVIEIGRPHTDMHDATRSIEQRRLHVYADFSDTAKPEVATFDFLLKNAGALPAYA